MYPGAQTIGSGPNPSWAYHDVLHNAETGEVWDPMGQELNGSANPDAPVNINAWKSQFHWDDIKWGVSPKN